jgi:dynein heavy chain
VGDINYGGRVSDPQDIRLIKALLSKLLNGNVLEEQAEGGFRFPTETGLEEIRGFIAGMSASDKPEFFGLHGNADIKFKKEFTK